MTHGIHTAYPLHVHSTYGAEVRNGAQNLVRRARQGDQNAIAMIVEIRLAAQDPENAKANQAFQALQDYVEASPTAESDKGGQVPALVQTAVLANGELLTDEQIHAMANAFGDEGMAEVFMFGVEHFREPQTLIEAAKELEHLPEGKRLLHLGRNVGMARNIQAVRMPHVPISEFSSMVGWELGE